jgi:hypothetical protein
MPLSATIIHATHGKTSLFQDELCEREGRVGKKIQKVISPS